MVKGKYRIKKYLGVYGYDSTARKVNGKPDICYYVMYKFDGKNRTEKIGWLSEGYTGQLAAEVRAQRMRKARHSGEVKTTSEIRAERKRTNRTLLEVKRHYFDSEHGKVLKGRGADLSRWDNHLAHLNIRSVPELSQLEIERIKVAMKMKELSPATIDHVLRLLRRIINHGVKYNMCPVLSFKIEFPKVNNIVTEYLTSEEVARLLYTLDNWKRQDIARMVKMAWLTGMRRGELFSLKQEHLNFTHRLIAISEPKGGEDATIPMSDAVSELLVAQIHFLDNEQKRREKRYHNTAKSMPEWTDNGYIFPGIHGKKRKGCGAINNIKKEAGLPAAFRPFHGLRHHLAVTLASSGEYTLDMIGELLTHKDSSVTRRYAAFLPEVKKKASDRAAEILQGQVAAGGITTQIKKKG